MKKEYCDKCDKEINAQIKTWKWVLFDEPRTGAMFFEEDEDNKIFCQSCYRKLKIWLCDK